MININQPDGQRLIAATQLNPTSVCLETRVEERWRPCALVEAVIQGADWPDEFILLHGHYDSWHFGIGDNATGNAGLLELARIFHSGRENLRRTIKVVWWPGHSTGRYAGSTWYADQFALELRDHCVAQVNMDSPGCVGATSYEEVMWMVECDSICRSAITDRTEAPIQRLRPLRAGDYSFNQIGISSFFMLSSNRPPEQRKEMGLYPVGGCGGNTVWHTEDDLMPVYDPEIMLQDLRIYVAALTRTANAEVLPFDHRAAVQEMREGLSDYEFASGHRLDLKPVREALSQLDAQLSRFYGALEAGQVAPTIANHLLKRIGRKLKADPAQLLTGRALRPRPGRAARASAQQGCQSTSRDDRNDPGRARVKPAQPPRFPRITQARRLAEGLFNPAEYRFRDHLAPAVDSFPECGVQLRPFMKETGRARLAKKRASPDYARTVGRS